MSLREQSSVAKVEIPGTMNSPKRSIASMTTALNSSTSQIDSANPFFQVSSDVVKLGTYGTQFRKLLSRKSSTPVPKEDVRRSPEVAKSTVQDTSPKQNGDLVDSELGMSVKRRPSQFPRALTSTLYSIRVTSESSWKDRLSARKKLFALKTKVANAALVFALTGIFLAVLDAELTAPGTGITKFDFASLVIRGLVVLSTCILLGFIICYHAIETKFYGIESGADDWRVAVTGERVGVLLVELVVCLICPFPGTTMMSWPYIKSDGRSTELVQVPVDVLLIIPMFLRSYLLCRFMVLHSKQFKDAATRSIAALNQITVDFRFIIKTLIFEHPLRVMVVFTICFWVCMAWVYTQCERFRQPKAHHISENDNYLNALWVVMVTFMSIGYGDIVPNTYCGRGVAIFTGVVGCGVSAGLIAVISRKLELSRAEKHVNNFMTDSKLTREHKNAAADVLQQTWFIHKYKSLQQSRDDIRVRMHQRRFLLAINEFRRVKWERRKLSEQGIALLDISKIRQEITEALYDIEHTQDIVQHQVQLLSTQMSEIQQFLWAHIPNTGSNDGLSHRDTASALTATTSATEVPDNLLLSPSDVTE